jgi:hypothetical protein
MTKFEIELQTLKPWDEVDSTIEKNGYQFIMTVGHGYLVVPVDDKNARAAKSLCKYGFIGELAYYLEEDCEAPAFLKKIA